MTSTLSKKSSKTIKKGFLLFAFVAVSTIALLYGISPNWFARTFLDLAEIPVDMAHVFRAMTGLYLALGLFWLFAAFNDQYRNAAVLTCALFAGGLLAGRLVSLLIDGRPSPILLVYVVIELALVPVAIWIFRLPR
jgi:hypothetical protein